MRVTVRYLPVLNPPRDRRGLAERRIKKELERRGWSVWRGDCLDILRRGELYPNVEKKYRHLQQLVEKHHPGTFAQLEYYCAVHHGLPDYLCYHPAHGFRFVECKLGYEQLSRRQKKCIPKLQALNFDVEVWKLVEKQTRRRLAELDLERGELSVKEEQARLTKRLLYRGRG